MPCTPCCNAGTADQCKLNPTAVRSVAYHAFKFAYLWWGAGWAVLRQHPSLHRQARGSGDGGRVPTSACLAAGSGCSTKGKWSFISFGPYPQTETFSAGSWRKVIRPRYYRGGSFGFCEHGSSRYRVLRCSTAWVLSGGECSFCRGFGCGGLERDFLTWFPDA